MEKFFEKYFGNYFGNSSGNSFENVFEKSFLCDFFWQIEFTTSVLSLDLSTVTVYGEFHISFLCKPVGMEN